VYIVAATADGFDILRGNSTQDAAVKIYSLPSVSHAALGTLITNDEIAAAQNYFKDNATNWGDTSQSQDALLTSLLASQPQVSITALRVAPNNQNLALILEYQKCIHYFQDECFGATSLLLIPGTSDDKTAQGPRVLWTLDRHTQHYVPPACINSSALYLNRVGIGDIRWADDGQTLIASLAGNCFNKMDANNAPLIAVPLSSKDPVFALVDAIAWSVASHHTLNTVKRTCLPQAGCTDAINVVKFQSNEQKVSSKAYSITYQRIDQVLGIGQSEDKIIFSGWPQGADTEGGFAFLDPQKAPQVVVSTSDINIQSIQSTLAGDFTVVEDKDAALWKLIVDDNKVHVSLLTKGPISSWSLKHQDRILVQFTGDSIYTIINSNGKTINTINVPQLLSSIEPADTQALFVDIGQNGDDDIANAIATSTP
jgi:hypothetical protein